MSRTRYYRLCLLVPLLLPLVAWGIIEGAEVASEHGWEAAGPAWAGMAILLPALAALFYGLPYAVLVAALWRPSRHWPLTTFRRLLLWLPLGLSAIAVAIVAGYNVLITHDAAWPSYAGQTGIAALSVGYGQALLIGAGEWVGGKLGWLRAATDPTSPSTNVA